MSRQATRICQDPENSFWLRSLLLRLVGCVQKHWNCELTGFLGGNICLWYQNSPGPRVLKLNKYLCMAPNQNRQMTSSSCQSSSEGYYCPRHLISRMFQLSYLAVICGGSGWWLPLAGPHPAFSILAVFFIVCRNLLYELGVLVGSLIHAQEKIAMP